MTIRINADYARAYNASMAVTGCNGHYPDACVQLAHAVGLEAVERAEEFARLHAPKEEPKGKTPKLLGCYVDGVLRFQSRDHAAIRDYADKQMRPRTMKLSDGSYRVITSDVWVAPVGSFIDAKQQAKLEEQVA